MTTHFNRRPRTVYFIKPIGMDGPIKIGCSVSPDGRRETLEQWSPFPLEIIAEIDGDMMLEARFHGYFRDEALRREWFKASVRLIDVIERIKAGVFDPAELPSYGPGLRVPRRKKDTSYITPNWCYKRSVYSRLGYMPGEAQLQFSDAIRSILAGGDNYLQHKPAIERLLARVTYGTSSEAAS